MPGAQDPKGIREVTKPKQVDAPPGTPQTGVLGAVGLGSVPKWWHWQVTRNDGTYTVYEGPNPPDPTTGQAEGAVSRGTATDDEVKKEWDKGETARGEGRIITGPDGRKYRVSGDTMTPLEGQTDQPRYRTFPDGSLRVEDPQAPDGWRIVATKPQGPTLNQAPNLERLPDGSLASWNPATSKWDVQFPAAVKPGALGDIGKAPAARPGQRTDLTAVYAAHELLRSQLEAKATADPSFWPQAQQLLVQDFEQNVKPALARANQEVTDYAATQAQRQHDADVRAQTATDRANDIRQQELEQTVRSNAQTQALGLAKMQVDPSFSPSLAGIYNRIIPGAFQPGAFNVNLPNLDAVADAAVRRAVALHQTTVPPLPTAGAITSSSASTMGLGPVPPVGARPGGAVPTGLPPVADPLARLNQLSGGPGAPPQY